MWISLSMETMVNKTVHLLLWINIFLYQESLWIWVQLAVYILWNLFYMARTLPKKAKVITNPKAHKISNILKKSIRWGLCLYITKSSGYTEVKWKALAKIFRCQNVTQKMDSLIAIWDPCDTACDWCRMHVLQYYCR